MFTLEDIAAGLAKVCRFGGQINRFYSVAQHSVLVSRLCPPNLKMLGLFHDAPEAYLGDVVKPLKNLIDSVYGPIEELFTHAIFEQFFLDPNQLPLIKQYDLQAYDAEHLYLRKKSYNTWIETCAMVNLDTDFWQPVHAEQMFLMEFHRLMKMEADGWPKS